MCNYYDKKGYIKINYYGMKIEEDVVWWNIYDNFSEMDCYFS